MDDLSVGASVCPVHCGKTADRIRMPFGIIGRTGPGMEGVLLRANLGRAIVTNVDASPALQLTCLNARQSSFPLPSMIRQHLSYDDCLEDKREDYQNTDKLFYI